MRRWFMPLRKCAFQRTRKFDRRPLVKVPGRTFTNYTPLRAIDRKKKILQQPCRTRFAPSPTGYLHLGSIRTALFNYLWAKKSSGQFLLRIEDTDEKRTVQGAEEKLCEDLQWAGLQWDEGPQVGGRVGPYRQSERTELYQKHADELLQTGCAYRCFCTTERLNDLAQRRKELGLHTDYDRQCASMSKDESDERAAKGESYVVRLLAPEFYPDFMDLIYGFEGGKKGPSKGLNFKFGEITYDDPILLKSDGRPTYHLANVVDDHFMEITHVVRASEWISSTRKHLALYQAFGWKAPEYAHVGLLVDENDQKLSKRNFDTNIAAFRDKGVFPSSLVNYVALMGWSHGGKSDVMTLDELVDNFQIKFTKGNTKVTLEKLWFLQRAHATRLARSDSSESQELIRQLIHAVKEMYVVDKAPNGESLEPFVRSLLKIDGKNFTTPAEFCTRHETIFTIPKPRPYEDGAFDESRLRETANRMMTTPLSEWQAASLKSKVTDITAGYNEDETKSQKEFMVAFYQYLRWVLFGGRPGPNVVDTMALVGKEECSRRMAASISCSQ